ncbi:recombinase family protein [Planococcus salinus]|uniref:Recombinase family protein n=1 Tax=Planococcus salinus TaxID=1848460 RepID=A0A3M8P3Q3_9BACL|nr:recombinase family protein [Planococcus salinus]RNF38305.1 recombinase family protein [Planococcus salinus]
MHIGYARPITGDPDCKEQMALFDKYGCKKVYIENHPSPKKRAELDKMLESLSIDDRVFVYKLQAFADSTRHLVELLELLDQKGAFLHSIQEDIDTSKGKSFSFSEIVRCLADFQSDTISAKTKAGLSEAKQKGMHAGRPRKPDANVKRAIEMYESKKYNLAEIKEQTGISKSTLYRYLEN